MKIKTLASFKHPVVYVIDSSAPLPNRLPFPFRRQNCVNISQFQTHKIDPAVTTYLLVIDPHQKFTPQNCPAKLSTGGIPIL